MTIGYIFPMAPPGASAPFPIWPKTPLSPAPADLPPLLHLQIRHPSASQAPDPPRSVTPANPEHLPWSRSSATAQPPNCPAQPLLNPRTTPLPTDPAIFPIESRTRVA